MKRLFVFLAAFSAMFISQRLSAQVDFSCLSEGDVVEPCLLLAADNTKMFRKKPETALQMFIYLDSDVCQKCIFVNKIHWLDFFELSKESAGRFKVDYIVEPGEHEIACWLSM